MNIREDVLQKIKVDEGKDVLTTYFDYALEKLKVEEGEDGIEECMRKIKETISEVTSFTTMKPSRNPVPAPDNTVAIVVDVRKRGSCRVYNTSKWLGGAGGADTANTKVVIMPWHHSWKYLCMGEMEIAFILAFPRP
ncbi:uncharacterized protein PV09_09666 [Verruconis gallopava]|uniref:Uncharacterized protein n=1 Tax=Verruconis gallopava TaxID=253628 RepID=A0A0D1ZX01_9PEZI|nr:uncharacterized protein PV09_09666 [Verruconis gallopava]KIV98529.1 hypothetical protein PV09_09666 [Verruconis gallopava]